MLSFLCQGNSDVGAAREAWDQAKSFSEVEGLAEVKVLSAEHPGHYMAICKVAESCLKAEAPE